MPGLRHEPHEGGVLALPVTGDHQPTDQATEAAAGLVSAINVAMRLSVRGFAGFALSGLIERRDDGLQNHVLFAGSATYVISGQAAGLRVSPSRPQRTIDERLIDLMLRMPAVAELSAIMAARPLTWAA